jgi:hypothetical protein
MVCLLYKNSVVTVTNDKTNDTVYIDESYSRSTHKRAELGKKMLRGRQWAIQNGLGPSTDLKYEYVLPDDEPYPHELSNYKTKIDDHE